MFASLQVCRAFEWNRLIYNLSERGRVEQETNLPAPLPLQPPPGGRRTPLDLSMRGGLKIRENCEFRVDVSFWEMGIGWHCGPGGGWYWKAPSWLLTTARKWIHSRRLCDMLIFLDERDWAMFWKSKCLLHQSCHFTGGRECVVGAFQVIWNEILWARVMLSGWTRSFWCSQFFTSRILLVALPLLLYLFYVHQPYSVVRLIPLCRL